MGIITLKNTICLTDAQSTCYLLLTTFISTNWAKCQSPKAKTNNCVNLGDINKVT